MEALRLIAIVLHVSFASIWFGPKLMVPSDARETSHSLEGPDHGLVSRLGRWAALDAIGAVGTFATGGVLLWLRDLGDIPLTVYLGVGVALALAGLTLTLTRSARRDLRTALVAGARPEATAAARRVARAVDFESLLWIAALGLMIV